METRGLIVTGHTVVMEGDSAINTTVKLGGVMNIFKGGSAYKTTVSNGSMVVHGGMASETTVSDGKLIVESKGIVSNTIISGGTMLIDSQSYAEGTVIYTNTIYVRGFATDTVISGGKVEVDSGGSANDITIETGRLTISNGTANSIFINSGGSMHLYANADASDISLYSSGVMHVWANAIASGIRNYDGILDIWTDGQVFDTILFGGRMDIQSGAEAINTTVSGGRTYIASGAKASGIIVSSGGTVILNSGGKASEIKIESGGSFYINNDVDLSNITISAGGCFNGMTFTEDLHFDSFSSGTHLSSAIITSSSTVTNGNIIDNAIISSGGELHVSYGATANRATILAGGIMHVSSGATANNTNVFSKGILYASSGGIINNTTVSGQLYILAGGTACQTYVQPYTTIYISSGGITYNTKLEYHAKMYVSSGGIVNNTSVYGDGWRYGALYILSGASANYTSVCMDGVIGISAGGTATNITQSKGGGIQFDVNSQTYIQGFHEGTAFELKNGIASNFVLYSSGYMTVESGGTANNTTVNYWGNMMISSGGSANYIVNSNGTIYNYGGIVNSTILYGNREQKTHVYGELIISSGGSANYTTINSDGRLSVINGNINYTSVNSGGYISIESGGYAKGVAISSGGIINGFTLQERIWYNEISDGIFSISSAVIHSGNIGIIFGGSAVFTTVNAGGNMVISSNGVHSSSLMIHDGGNVIVQNGGIVDFTLTGRTSNDDYLINNLALISGTPKYTITVSTDQAHGIYKLAQGANSFTQTISIGNGTSVFGSLQCNGPALSYNALHYLLEETDGNLILRIGASTQPPAPLVSVSTTAPTNNAVTITATFDPVIITRQYSFDQTNWISYTSSVKLSSNGTIYFRGINALGMESEITQYTVSNIDKISPEKPIANADITIPTNKDVKVSATFSNDSIVKEYSLDKTTWLEYTAEIVMQTNGTVYFRGKDAAGNTSDIAEFIVSNIDKTAPEKPTASADITTPTNKDVKVSATFSNDSITKEYSLDGRIWLEYTTGIVMQINGVVFFRSMDNAGNYSEITRYEVSNIDRIAPEKPIVTVNTTEPTNRNVVVSAVFAPDSVQNEYKLDNGEWIKYITAVELFKNGTIYFRCKDAAGNCTETNYTVSNIDRVAPEKPTVSANITTPTNQDVIISAFFSQDSQIKEYSLDGIFWIPYTDRISMRDNGTVYFRAQDAAGNCSEMTEYSVTNIDRTPPLKPVISTDITKPTNQNVIVSAVFSNDSNVREYSLDGRIWNAYRSGISVSENCTVYFRAFDTAGNISEISKYEVMNIDRIAPERPIVSADITVPTSQNVTLFAEFSKDSVKKEYSWNGWDWNEYTTGISVSNNGPLFFRSMDCAGNYSETVQYTVDNILSSTPEPEQPDKPDTPDLPTTPVTPEGPDVGGYVIVKKYNATYSWNRYIAPKGTKVSYEILVDGHLATSKKNKYTLKKASVANHSFSVRTILTTKKQAPVYTDWSKVTTQYVADVTAPKTGKLSLVQTGEDSVKLNWTAANDNVGVSRYIVTCGNETRELGGGIFETEFHGKAGKVAASIIAYDEAGNAGKTVKKTLSMKDMTAPTQVSGLRSEGVDNKSGGVLAWNPSSDNVGVTQYLIAIEGGKTCKSKTNSVRIKKMAAGTYRYTVIALDKAKNQSIVSTAGEFTVADVICPKIKKLSSKVTDQSAAVTWNATDEVGIVRSELWCDDQRFDTTGLSSWNLSGLESGRHTLRLNVWDAAGNMSVKMANCNVKALAQTASSAGMLAAI